jgi:hypothetical protein
MRTVSGAIDLSQRLAHKAHHNPCGEVDPKDFVHFHYVKLP